MGPPTPEGIAAGTRPGLCRTVCVAGARPPRPQSPATSSVCGRFGKFLGEGFLRKKTTERVGKEKGKVIRGIRVILFVLCLR